MRFSAFLFLFLFLVSLSFSVKSQNLIADWSAEEYSECPYLLTMELFLPTWTALRGTPDYFNFCSSNLSPLVNPLGSQYPRTGAGILGAVTYHGGLSNGREYPGVQLSEQLVIGQSYALSYYVSAAYSHNVTELATNNLGILLMTENYLTPEELGYIPNFAHINMDTLVTDTANWVHVYGTIIADSAYQYAAFGNFFDDVNTNVTFIDPEHPDSSSIAYYYMDDFCVTAENGECFSALRTIESRASSVFMIYPNPNSGIFWIDSQSDLISVNIFSSPGTLIRSYPDILHKDTAMLDLRDVSDGVYIAVVETKEGIAMERIVITP